MFRETSSSIPNRVAEHRIDEIVLRHNVNSDTSKLKPLIIEYDRITAYSDRGLSLDENVLSGLKQKIALTLIELDIKLPTRLVGGQDTALDYFIQKLIPILAEG